MGAGSLGAGWDCRAWRVDADVVVAVVVVVVSVLVTGVNKESERVWSFHCLHSFFIHPSICFLLN